jgi:DNA-binding beta-propeller fold protein YncE
VNDRLYLLDGTGLRTLVFDDMTNAAEFFEDAEHVIGQEDFTSIVADGAGLNMLTEEPYGLTYHAASDQLVVAALLEDVGRTLIFDVSTFEPGELAVDALSAMEVGMMKPEGVAIDTVNHRLFVTDSSRVLVFELDENNDLVDVYSDRALGVPTVHAIEADTSGVSADVFNGVAALAYDSLHNILYVEDYGNSRVLGFNVGASIEDITNGMSASLVFGQEDFISNIQEVDLDSIYYPGGIAVDEVGDRLFVADIFSNRVMVFENASMAAPGPDAVAIIGQEDYSANSGGSGTAALNTPAGVAYDAGNDRLFVADVYNNRVVVYDTSDVQEFSEPAAHVLGQVIFDDNDMNRGGVAAAGTLALPVALAYDQYEERLLVVEVVNSRALVYDLSGGITNGMDAVQVIGQPDFETTVDPGTDNATQNNFYILGGQTLSGATFAPNRLLFSDSLNARILVFGAGSSSSGGSRGGSGDIYPPTLHEIESAPLSTSEMRLTWVTNEASDSVVRYGITSAYGHTTTEPAFVTSHIVGLANLSPSTTYHFQVCSNDSFYNLGCSEDMTFTTPSIGEVIPEIGEDGEEESLWVPEYDAQGHSTGMFMSGPSFTGLGVTVSDVTRDSVTITWTTDEASGTHVEYGTGIPYSHDKVVDGLVTTHTVRLTGLSSGTTYHFRVASQGTDAMRSVSEDYTFRTN